jgi:FlaG/FlaF family flagellin (archaellin)
MRKLFLFSLVFAVAMTFGFTSAFAGPSAKATAQIGDLSVIEVSGSGGSGETNTNDTGWGTLFTQTIKTPQDKDLFIDVSLECGLTTDTTVMSKKLARAIATAEAIVEVRVLVDDVPVAVNGNDPADTDITFARRHQTLIAEFAGDFSDCMTVDLDTGEVTVDWALVDPEMLQLILDTMQANSFNFVVPDLSAGEYTVQIQAKLSYEASGNLVQETIDGETVTMAEGQAFAKAYLGNGSVTIETVRMIKGEDVVVDLE